MARSKTREHDLAKLVMDTCPDIVLLTETELPSSDTITLPGYVTFLPPPSSLGTIRLAVLVKTEVAAAAEVLEATPMDLWLTLSAHDFVVAAVYRQWSDPNEKETLTTFHMWCATHTAAAGKLLIADKFNLASDRANNAGYSRVAMLESHLSAMSAAGLEYVGPFTSTFYSHGFFNGHRRTSILDHGYAAGLVPSAVDVLGMAATDHRPVLFDLPVRRSSAPLCTRLSRSLRRVSDVALCQAIESHLPPDLYAWNDVNAVHKSIVDAITAALDQLAPLRPVKVREGLSLCLAQDTLQAMRERDQAAKQHSPLFRSLRNRAARLVRRDKLSSALKSINNASGDARKMWKLASQAIGNGNSTVPASLTADCLNDFYISKIAKIRSGITSTSINNPMGLSSPPVFAFKFPNAGKVAKVMASLKNTRAIGEDGIGVEALKKGISALAGPIAHLVRVSLVTSRVPDGFKAATITPVFKGKRKSPTDPASYRPVAILPAMSKILEKLVAESLTSHLQELLPNSQFGFRPKRNSTAAIAYAHSAWSAAKKEGKIVAIAAYDLSAAFDTVDIDVLSIKLGRLGINGSAKAWFVDYLSSRKQRVAANGKLSSYQPVEFGVPQGSILGPILFLAMVAELPAFMGVEGLGGGSVGYADDIVAWVSGSSADVVRLKLETVSNRVLAYARSHFLAVNGDKTQIMWLGCRDCPSVTVDGHPISAAKSVEILGVGFDRSLRASPFVKAQEQAAKRILGVTRRLTYHLPSYAALQISNTLFTGKLGYAVAAAIVPRLSDADPTTPGLQAWQVAVNNAARVSLNLKAMDKIPIDQLLRRSGLPSINRLAVRAAIIETWKAIRVRDGPGGTPNPLGHLIGNPGSGVRATRATAAGLLPPPICDKDTLVWFAYRVWNVSEELRAAKSLVAAKRVATKLAATAPL